MNFNFRDIFPALEPALESLAHAPFIQSVNEAVWIFALVETGHLLFLTILGGAVFALNFRFLGLVLQGVPIEEVEQATRRWYWIGAAGTIITGVAMGITTSRTLLPSGAFFVKMLALVAAIALSNVVIRQARRGSAARLNAVAIIAGIAIWFFSLYLFATTATLNSGSFLIALAGGALLAAAAQRQHRPAVIGVVVLALAGWFVSLDTLGAPSEGKSFFWIGSGIIAALVVLVAGLGVRDVRTKAFDKEAIQKLTVFASTLAWVTVTAAGRWIGFS
jgi:hypothetical protein